MRTVFCLFLLFYSIPPVSQPGVAAPSQENVVGEFLGTWQLMSFVRQEVPSGATSDVMGPHPSGFINYGRDGRMMVIITGSDRKKPAGSVATQAELDSLTKGLVSYAGTYSVDVSARTVTHHIDISWNEVYTGTNQTRNYDLKGDLLRLTTVPSPDPVTGKMTVRVLAWQRYSPR
jgi:lipocalin-like protein